MRRRKCGWEMDKNVLNKRKKGEKRPKRRILQLAAAGKIFLGGGDVSHFRTRLLAA
jgi:hypothetical protein